MTSQPKSQILPKTGSILSVTDFEFRVSHSFSPPRPEFRTFAYELLPKKHDLQKTDLGLILRLSKIEPIRNLLETVCKLFVTDTAPVASQLPQKMAVPGMKANSPREHGESSPISQVQFQTQMPWVDAHSARSTSISNTKTLVPNQTKTSDERLLDLLGPRSPHGQAQRAMGPPVSVHPRKPQQAEHLPESRRIDNHQSSPELPESSILTQKPLKAASSSYIAQDRLSDSKALSPAERDVRQGRHQQEQSCKAENHSVEQEQPEQLMPIRLIQHLRSSRAEAMANKYTSARFGRLSRIPKAQLALLSSQTSYYPALVGHDNRPGTVPHALHTALIARANRPTPAQSLQKIDTTAAPAQDLLKHHTAENDSPLLNSSQPVSNWSQSPEPAARKPLLPSDSSPSHAPAEDIDDDEGLQSQADDISSFLPADKPMQTDLIEQTIVSAEKLVQSANTTESFDDAEPQAGDLPHDDCVVAVFPELLCTAQGPEQATQNGVQVKRTPYPGEGTTYSGKVSNIHGSPEALLSSAGDRILSTYDNVLIQPRSRNVDPETGRISVASAMGEEFVITDAVEPPITSKRRGSDSGDQAEQSKRPKLFSKGRASNNFDPDYGPVIASIRERRSHELQALASNSMLQQQANESSIVSGGIRSRPSSRSDMTKPASTLMTVPSGPGPPTHSTTKPVSEPPRDSSDVVVADSLYQRYRDVYQDYRGDQKAFNAAFKLLQRFRRAQSGLHPALFDDFIYHHFHTYRDYLLHAADSGEDPLPFASYYDQYVETPAHYERVVTLRNLDAGSRDINFPQRLSTGSFLAPGSAGRSIDVGSSVSQPKIRPPAESHPAIALPFPKDINHLNTAVAAPDLPGNGLDPTQKSSVDDWIENVRQPSPELGTPDVDRSGGEPLEPDPLSRLPPKRHSLGTNNRTPYSAAKDAMPPPSTAPPAFARSRSRFSSSPFVSKQRKRDSATGRSNDTPFQKFADKLSKTHAVRLENAALARGKRVIDVFSWR